MVGGSDELTGRPILATHHGNASNLNLCLTNARFIAVPIHKCPIARFPRQAQIIILEILQCIPAVIIFTFLELEQIFSFVDGH